MTRRRWVRMEPTGRDRAAAAVVATALGASVGVVTFYLARMMVTREPLPEFPPPEDDPPRSLP